MYILEKKKLSRYYHLEKALRCLRASKVESYSQFLPFDTAEPIELDNPHNTFPSQSTFFTAIRDNVEIQQPARSLKTCD